MVVVLVAVAPRAAVDPSQGLASPLSNPYASLVMSVYSLNSILYSCTPLRLLGVKPTFPGSSSLCRVEISWVLFATLALEACCRSDGQCDMDPRSSPLPCRSSSKCESQGCDHRDWGGHPALREASRCLPKEEGTRLGRILYEAVGYPLS